MDPTRDTFPATRPDLPSYVRKSLSIDKIRKTFEEDSIVVIDNFLEPAYADQLHAYFAGQPHHENKYPMPPHWWVQSCRSAKGVENVLLHPGSEERVKKAREAAYETHGQNSFSYSFRRTMKNHYKTCDCPECILRGRFSEMPFMRVLQALTGMEVKTAGETFASCYTGGDYLSTHTDKGNGKLTFVLNLTKGWNPDYGGNLHMKHPINRQFAPGFNKLVLFRVPDGGVAHFVAPVGQGVKAKRLSFTGWYW